MIHDLEVEKEKEIGHTGDRTRILSISVVGFPLSSPNVEVLLLIVVAMRLNNRVYRGIPQPSTKMILLLNL